MNKTAILLVVAIAATAFVATAPTAAADTIADCGVFWTLDGHNPAHCVPDCTGEHNPLDCSHDDD
jgi:hypothetical protein